MPSFETAPGLSGHLKHLLVLHFELISYEQREPLHGGVELLLGRDAEGRPQVLARLVSVGLEGAAGHEHDVALQPPGHGHVPGGGQARHPDPEEHPAQRYGVLAQTRQVLVGRREHRVPPLLVETLHGVDVIEEALVTPGLQEFVSDHLAQ